MHACNGWMLRSNSAGCSCSATCSVSTCAPALRGYAYGMRSRGLGNGDFLTRVQLSELGIAQGGILDGLPIRPVSRNNAE